MFHELNRNQARAEVFQSDAVTRTTELGAKTIGAALLLLPFSPKILSLHQARTVDVSCFLYPGRIIGPE